MGKVQTYGVKRPLGKRIGLFFRNYWQLCLLLLIPMAFLIVFSYVPMYGLQIAFKDYKTSLGMWDSPWVGLKHFEDFFGSYQFVRVIRNTLTLSLYSLIAGFPIPIILALSLHCCLSQRFKKLVQTVTYAPYFISTVVLVGMLMQVLSPKYGIINHLIRALGGEEVLFMSEGTMFSSIYVWSGIWQSAGWSAIIYIAALSGIDPGLHEAAIVDGASRLRRIWHIDLPGILPTITIILIMNAGSLLGIGYEKVLLMQNATNLEYSEVISTYLYKVGLTASMPNYSYSTAVGLFNSVINFLILILVNSLSKRLSETSLW